MINAEHPAANWPSYSLTALRREELLSQGRHDAFLFVLQCNGDANKLRSEIQDVEQEISAPPDFLKGPMTPNASPRIYKDGYLTGLRDALKIVSENEE